MRKVLAVGILLFIISAGFFWFYKSNASIINPAQNNTPTPMPAPLPDNTLDYRFNNSDYRISWFIANPKLLIFIPNYTEKRTSPEIKKSYGCNRLVNAGFYNKDGSPIGLVVNNGSIINNFQENSLFNGIFSIDNNCSPLISLNILNNPKLAVQSGPILMLNGQTANLNINDGESARRIVVAITNDGKLIFLSFYKSDNVYEGPLLADLPTHLQKFEKLSDINISYAINLDGGSASVFISDRINLGELTNVGSFFCGK